MCTDFCGRIGWKWALPFLPYGENVYCDGSFGVCLLIRILWFTQVMPGNDIEGSFIGSSIQVPMLGLRLTSFQARVVCYVCFCALLRSFETMLNCRSCLSLETLHRSNSDQVEMFQLCRIFDFAPSIWNRNP